MYYPHVGLACNTQSSDQREDNVEKYAPFGTFDTVDWYLDRACRAERKGFHRAAEANLELALWREEIERRINTTL